MALARWIKQFRIFYKSRYGKAGFWILLIFAVIAMISPIIAPLPYSYIAPSIDTHVAKMRFEGNITNLPAGSQFTPIVSSSTGATGSYVVYYAMSNGKVYAMGLGGSSDTATGRIFNITTINVNSTNTMFAPSVITFSDFQHLLTLESLSLSNFLVTGTSNGSLSVSKIVWSGGTTGTGHPELNNTYNYSENGSLVYSPVTSSEELGVIIPAYVPFYNVKNASQISNTGGSEALLFTVTENSTGYYLNGFTADPLVHLWSVFVSSSTKPSEPVYYGSFFSSVSGSEVIMSVGNRLIAYSPGSGHENWNVSFNSTLIGQTLYIPSGYQFNPTINNSLFLATSDNIVYGVYLNNHTAYRILNTSSPINYISTDPSSLGVFPAYFLTETNFSLYLTAQGNMSQFTSTQFQLPTEHGSFIYSPIYDENSATFIIASSYGLLVSVQGSLGQYPITWSVTLPKYNVTQPDVFLDSATGRYEIGVLSQAGHLFVYDAQAYNINPIPPTLHAPSGNSYLLGTNIAGQDVFNQFIQSFTYDWFLGLVIGVAIILVATLVAMIIGYVGGASGSVLETVSLAVYLIPGLALLIALASVLGPGYLNIIFIITFISWPFTTFTLIGLVRQIKIRSYVESARLSGAGTLSILRRHVMPNIAPLLIYLLALSIDGAVAGVSTLQFLGLAPLTTPTWGGMLSLLLGNFFLASGAPWWVLPPAIALTMFIFAFIFVSRGLDEVVNPRLRRR